MANCGDIGNRTCPKCGVVYCRFISNICPVCKLVNSKDTDFLLEMYLDNSKNGWNGDV